MIRILTLFLLLNTCLVNAQSLVCVDCGCQASTFLGTSNFINNGTAQSSTIKILLNNAVAGTTTFNISSNGLDFTPSTYSASITAGQSSVTIPITFTGKSTFTIANNVTIVESVTVTANGYSGSCSMNIPIAGTAVTASPSITSATLSPSTFTSSTNATSQSAVLTVNLSNATAGSATFSLVSSGLHFTPATYTTTLTSGQTSVSIPIVFDGTSSLTSETITVTSTSLSGSQVATATISAASTAGTVTALNCSSAILSPSTATASSAYSGTATVGYIGGNAGTYTAQSVTSTGVTGLTAVLSAGTLASGAGSVAYTVSGTPSASGTASFALTLGGQSCTLTLTVSAASTAGTVTALNCSSATLSPSTATASSAYSGTATVGYTSGNAGTYAVQSVTSTGVTGLTAVLSAGTLASGAGSVAYTVSGTPSASGTASFALTLGGQSCTLTLTVSAASTAGTVTALNCSSATLSPSTATASSAYSGTATVGYTGGNAGTYAAQSVTSTGVTGLTAVLSAGTLASGAGSVAYTVSGTPSASGTASFALTLGGQSCTLTLTVSAASTSCTSGATGGIENIVCLANAFKATLSTTQISTLEKTYSLSNAKTWSNLPAAMSARLGIRLGDLTSTQLAAAKALIKEISGTTSNEGYEEIQQIWLADDVLVTEGASSSTYGSGNYYISFFGTPSLTGKFEIQETGHHKTISNTYNAGVMTGATPQFTAVEPTSFTSGGTTYTPVSQERDAMAALLTGLSTANAATAKQSATYGDIVLGPGSDWVFPTTKIGVPGSSLSSSEQTLLLNVIKTYTNDIDDTNAASILATYTSELSSTYVAYSGTTAMNTKFDYFRIDGPHVWIEFTVQGGIVLSAVHFHSVWRDRSTDYGGTTN